MKKLNLRLLRTIKHSKGQYFSLLFVVITGLTIYTSLNNASTNLETSLNEYYTMTNFADMFVDIVNIPRQKVVEIENMENIKEVEGRIVMDVPFITDKRDEDVRVRIVSVDSKENKINKIFINKGKRALGNKDILVLEQFALARGIELGDDISLQLNGRKSNFKVVGLVSSPEYAYVMESEQSLMPQPNKFGIVFIEEGYLSQILGIKNGYNNVVVTLEDYEKYKIVEDELQKELDKYGVRRIIKKDDQLSNSVLHQEIEGLKTMSGFIPIIFLFTAAAILTSMISRTVKNERMAIGVLKALGYSNKQIYIYYIKYAFSIGVIGGIVGTVLGTLLSGMMTQVYLQFFYIPILRVKIYPLYIVYAVLLSSFFCIGAGLYGARGVLKISPAESMKPEPPKTGKKILLERFTGLWKRVSFSWKIVFRNVFREKKRFLLISMGAGFTVAMSLMVFWTSSMVDSMFFEHYGEFMTMDYSMSFRNPITNHSLIDLEKIVDVEHIEGKLELPMELGYGRKSRVVSIIGLSKYTQFFNFKDFNDNHVDLPKKGMLISSNLADLLGVEEGDKILIKNYLPNSDDVEIEIAGIIKQTLGINAYMDLEYMNENITKQDIINGALIKSDNLIYDEVDNLENVAGIQSIAEMRESFMEYLDLTNASIYFMVLFSGILGFVIIYSMNIMSINERKTEFSSLRVLGFSKSKVFNLLVKENFLMSIVGVIYGIPLGLLLIEGMRSIFITELYTFDGPVTIMNIIYSIIYTFFCLFIAQLSTYRKIHKLDFIEALKNRTT